MGNDKKEEKVENNASTSKLEDKSRRDSGQEDLDDEEREMRSNSYGSDSSASSRVSDMDVTNTDTAIPKTSSAMKKGIEQRGSTARQAGRVRKRRVRTNGRRKAARKPRVSPNARRNRRTRNGLAVTTLRERSKAQIQFCEKCGHQIMRR